LLSRRRVLGLGAGLAVAGLGAGALIRRGAGAQTPVEGLPLVEPAVRASRDGLLETSLTARESRIALAGRTVSSMVYEGSFPGPTLRVRPGDTLKLRLSNQLSAPTNLHTHGLHVSPSGNSDNVLLHIHPGQTFDFQFDIPQNHAAGFNWYHPHLHGEVTEQVFGGMAGALIVEGDLDALPGIAGLRERVLVLQATQHDREGDTVPPSASRAQSQFGRLVNGQLRPLIDIRPGETQRWRFLNASPNVFFRLHLDGHVLHEIGTDGNTLAEPRARDEILLSPGERSEVLVRSDGAGRFALRSLDFDGGFSVQPEVVLATMVSDGAPVAPRPLPETLLPFFDLRALPVDQKRLITFQVLPLNRFAPVIPMATFMVDNKLFDMDRVDQVMRLGSTEEWTVRNGSNNWHPFHIHINDFQVTRINGEPVEARGLKDTVAIPPFGEMTMRTRFLDFTGKFVFHCHILQHEDGGMMQVVEVR